MDPHSLRPLLHKLTADYGLAHLSSDPVEIVHEYDDPGDQEVVGLIAACLAYGNVRTILRSVRRVVSALGPSPREAVLGLTSASALRRLDGFRHRFTSDIDMARLLTLNTAHVIDHAGVREAQVWISKIKAEVPNVAIQVIDDAIQMHGAAGLSQDFPLAAMYTAARTLRLADGPDEVHRMVVARHELRPYVK